MDTLNSDLKGIAPVPAASTLEVAAAPAAPALPAAPKGEIPKTTGTTPGGWNRFAGYNPNDAKNKSRDRRDSKGRR